MQEGSYKYLPGCTVVQMAINEDVHFLWVIALGW